MAKAVYAAENMVITGRICFIPFYTYKAILDLPVHRLLFSYLEKREIALKLEGSAHFSNGSAVDAENRLNKQIEYLKDHAEKSCAFRYNSLVFC
jgi:hypothetical protein